MFQVSLAAARVNARKSQKDAAAAVGKSVSTVKSWESGRTAPDAVSFCKLCDLYKVPVDLIFLPKK